MPRKILIVDDEPQIALLLNSRLRANGYSVLVAYDAIQGFRSAVNEQPDLILLDIRMPAGGGASVFENLQHNIKTSLIPVIFMTAHPNADIEKACRDSGAVDFISKPFEPDEVLLKIKSALSGSRDPGAGTSP
jgi:DNA-binding response OmpR family regulator